MKNCYYKFKTNQEAITSVQKLYQLFKKVTTHINSVLIKEKAEYQESYILVLKEVALKKKKVSQ